MRDCTYIVYTFINPERYKKTHILKFITLIVATLLIIVATKESTEIYEAEAREPIKVIEIVELKTDRPEVEKKIREKAKEYGLNPNEMVNIAIAESDLRQVWNYRYEENRSYYTAFGVYMIVESTYEAFCGHADERFDIDKNIECGMIIASESGNHHWNESKDVWLAMN